MEPITRHGCALLALCLLASTVQSDPGPRRHSRPQLFANQILVKFKPGMAPSQSAGWARAKGMMVSGAIASQDVVALEIPPGETRETMLARLQSEVGRTLEYAEANPIRYADFTPNDPTLAIEALSGGNQQKVVVGRWLDSGRRLLITEDPTAGVDVGAKAEIYHLLYEALASGMGVLVVSTDFEEIAAICHRAIVFSRGLPVSELSGVELSTESLIQAASAGEAA